jgi:hypothetical protein
VSALALRDAVRLGRRGGSLDRIVGGQGHRRHSRPLALNYSLSGLVDWGEVAAMTVGAALPGPWQG